MKTIYGEEWWIKGISRVIRKRIAQNYEENDCIGNKFDYTYIWDLAKIWERNISDFSKISPFMEWGTKWNTIEKDFMKLNSMRNKLMHPTRNYIPSEDDREFLEEFAQKIFS